MLNRLIRLSFCKVSKFRAQNLISISEKSFMPVFQFESMNLQHKLFQNIKSMSWKSESFSILDKGQNLVGISKTGSGKTLGFLLPLVNKLLNNKKQPDQFKSPRILIVEPTRELCKQTYFVSRDLVKQTGIWSAFIHGGLGSKIFENVNNRNIDILVSTPGILLDGIRRNLINLSKTQFVILDEADFLLQIGFRQDLLKINDQVKNPNAQKLFFSATWDDSVRQVVNSLTQRKFVMLRIGQQNKTINQNISEQIIVINQQMIESKLINLLQNQLKGLKILIFCNTKSTVDHLHYLLNRKVSCIRQHSDITQMQRLHNHNKFKQGQAKVMIATNVAARGLDVKDIDVVINYNLPKTIEQYTHRIGRTGRAGQKGRSISLCSANERLFLDIKKRSNVKILSM